MTLDELDQLFWLRKEVERLDRRIKAIESQAYNPSSQVLTGMPAEPHTNASRVEKYAVELTDLRDVLTKRRAECRELVVRIERFISSIPDSLTRLAFSYRYVDGLEWNGVADALGGNSEASVKMMCYRYLDKVNAEDET